MAKTHLWLYISSVNGHQAMIMVRSPYKKSARRKMAYFASGNGMLTWQEDKLNKESEEELLKKFKPNELYLSEEKFANA